MDSQATIGNATITSTNLTGVLLGRLNIGSTARITDSQISGGFAGAQASARSQLIIQRSQVTATTPAGVGLRLLGGSADVSANSVITGQTAGIRLAQESPTVNVPALTLDNSHVVGVNGPAIAAGGGTEATLQVSNGSTLTGNNGVALNLERTSNLAAVVEDSRLVGGVTVAEQALGDLLFDNSQIDGHLQIAGTLDASLDQSTLNGNLNVSELGDASARFTDTAAMNGNIDSAGAAVVSFEQSNMTGNAVVTDTGTLNLSFSEGSMTGNIESAGNATATFNQSTLTGDAVAATGGTLNLTMTDGRMDGNIDSAGSATVDLARTALMGNATVANGGTLGMTVNGGSMTGDIESAGTASATFNQATLSGNALAATGGTLNMTMTDGRMDGNIDSAGSATVDLTRTALTGNATVFNGGTLGMSLNGGSMAGDIESAGTATATFNQATLTGDAVAATGGTLNLNMTDGRMNGNIESAGTVTANLSQSALTGNAIVTDAGTLDLTLNGGSMAGDIQSAGAATSTFNQATLTGNAVVADAGKLDLSFNGGAMQGNIDSAGSTTATFNQAALTGNGTVTNTGSLSLALDQGQMTGNVTAASGAMADVSLFNNSTLLGTLNNVRNANVASGSNWTLNGNSSVGDLALNGGQVTFGDTPSFHELTVNNLSGNGTFVMGSDFVSGETDQLIVTGSSSGNHGLLVASSGNEATVESMRLVQTQDGAAQFHLLNDRDRVDVGAYSYEMTKDENNDWVLNRETRTISPMTRSVMALFNTPITVAYGELSSLRSRMGELRYSEGRDAGLWMRAYGNKYNVSGASSGAGYQQNQHGLSLGADMQVAETDWLVGVLGGTSRSDLNLDYGTSGRVDSYYLGGYATWLDRETGYYVDTVVKYNRYQNNAKVGLSDSTRTKGDYDTHGLSGSVEAGKHIKLNDGYFIEPFAQVATAVVAGKDYSFDNGLRAEGDTARSLLGKVGTTVGKTIPLDGGGMLQPYVKAAFAHEFVKRNEVQVNNNVFNNDLSGSRAELGAGVSLALSKQFRVHADVEYSNGKHIEQPYGVNLGVRYDF
ncbi:autotransporter outer membrane beta-barrel domain-containing protein [Pseudomonas urmiensis]|uniref:Autotransporter outer membrane beta-barrel domain-containing protein n=1 Tax=Pseudomonas urmiensis TaxID=2745493 RepID=A0A9E2T4W6_9PSED|nr:autotransporter outer membrane beta-barrel domain-containing protein [Pseudomonas urmiensis]